MKDRFILTKHAVTRLAERDKDFKKTIQGLANPTDILKLAYEYFKEAVEERTFINNSNFMTMLGEKYGFDKKFHMYVRNDSIFVCVIDDQAHVVVTVVQKSQHYCRNIAGKNTKYKKGSQNEHRT